MTAPLGGLVLTTERAIRQRESRRPAAEARAAIRHVVERADARLVDLLKERLQTRLATADERLRLFHLSTSETTPLK
jgi:hypothetical protein